MPFDCANYGSELLQRLRQGRDRLAAGLWCQRRLSVLGNNGMVHFCMVGSVSCDDDGSERALDPIAYKAQRVIAEVIRRQTGECPGSLNIIPRYNDDVRTTHEDVVQIMDTAVKLQEIEELLPALQC